MLKLKFQYFGTWWEELTHWKRPWCWERLRAGGEGNNRGWDGWMVPPTQWTWVWASSGSQWWTGKPGMLQSMGSQRVGHNWAAELNHLRKNLSLTTKLPSSLKTGVKEKAASHTGRCWFFTWAPWSWKRVNVRNVCIPSSPEKDPPSPDDWDMTQGCFPQHPHLFTYDKLSVSHSVMPDSLRPHGLQPTRLLCLWDFPGKDTGVGCHFLLQGIFPTQGSNLGPLHCRQILYWLS